MEVLGWKPGPPCPVSQQLRDRAGLPAPQLVFAADYDIEDVRSHAAHPPDVGVPAVAGDSDLPDQPSAGLSELGNYLAQGAQAVGIVRVVQHDPVSAPFQHIQA